MHFMSTSDELAVCSHTALVRAPCTKHWHRCLVHWHQGQQLAAGIMNHMHHGFHSKIWYVNRAVKVYARPGSRCNLGVYGLLAFQRPRRAVESLRLGALAVERIFQYLH
jgi:hypothetical protein